MTEKRFEYCIDEIGMYYYICDNTKKGDDRIIIELDTKFDAIEVCNLLNKLNDENEQLKNKLKFFNELNKPYGDIIKENEQLKQLNIQINEIKDIVVDCRGRIVGVYYND